jgi:hypothetical protein
MSSPRAEVALAPPTNRYARSQRGVRAGQVMPPSCCCALAGGVTLDAPPAISPSRSVPWASGAPSPAAQGLPRQTTRVPESLDHALADRHDSRNTMSRPMQLIARSVPKTSGTDHQRLPACTRPRSPPLRAGLPCPVEHAPRQASTRPATRGRKSTFSKNKSEHSQQPWETPALARRASDLPT